MKTSTVPTRRLLAIGATAAASAAAINAAIFGLGRAADITYIVKQTHTGPALINATDVVTFSLMTFAVGLVAAIIAARIGRPSLQTMQRVGATIAVLSIAMDLPIDATVPAKATLALMHLVVGAAYLLSLHVAKTSASTAVRSPHASEIGERTMGAAA